MHKRDFFLRMSDFFSALTPQRVLSLLCLLISLFLFVQLANAKCINDYRIQHRKILHKIHPYDLRKLDDLAEKGQIAQGWKLITRLGDPYASLVTAVLFGGPGPRDKFLQKLISIHWINTVGLKAYKSLFYPTAQLHFKQYVQLLHFGYWPDSDQIILSYLTAVRKNNLPDITILDAAWEAAGFNYFRSWQSLNRFQSSRTIFPTHACMKVNRFEAQKILAQDFFEVPFEFIFTR